jgi:hypothetical protein
MKALILPTLLFSTFFATAQSTNFNKFSIETSYGLNHPLAPVEILRSYDGIDAADFSEFKHFDLGARYMVNSVYGVSLKYAYDRFQYDGSNLATSFYRIGAEAVINVTKLLNTSFNRRRTIEIQAHGGVGLSIVQSKANTGIDRIGNIIVGVRPMFKISNSIALTTDLSYIVNIRQHYDYGGESFFSSEPDGLTGGFINFSVGLNFYFGEKRFHADWY